MVIIDNHVSDANWCCSVDDGNGLWYTNNWPEDKFFDAWKGMAARFLNQPMVIGADLRNELRPTFVEMEFRHPRWGSGDPKNDWHLAAIRAAQEIQAINSNLLFIQGTYYAQYLWKVPEFSVVLSVPNKLVYAIHEYSWFHGGINFGIETEETYQKYKSTLDLNWGFLLEEGTTYTAPVWVGEFGTNHNKEGLTYYFSSCLVRYMRENDLDFAYWPVDGTQSRGDGRVFGAEETFGILNTLWNGVAYRPLYQIIASLISPTQFPTSDSE